MGFRRGGADGGTPARPLRVVRRTGHRLLRRPGRHGRCPPHSGRAGQRHVGADRPVPVAERGGRNALTAVPITCRIFTGGGPNENTDSWSMPRPAACTAATVSRLG